MKKTLVIMTLLATSVAFAGPKAQFDKLAKKYDDAELREVISQDIGKVKSVKCDRNLVDVETNSTFPVLDIYATTSNCVCHIEIPKSEYWPTYPKHSASCFQTAN